MIARVFTCEVPWDGEGNHVSRVAITTGLYDMAPITRILSEAGFSFAIVTHTGSLLQIADLCKKPQHCPECHVRALSLVGGIRMRMGQITDPTEGVNNYLRTN